MMVNIDERVGVVEQRVGQLESWRLEHCADNERQIEALSKLPAEISGLVAKVDLLIVRVNQTMGQLWKLCFLLAVALIVLALVAWGAERFIPTVIQGGA